MNRKSNWVPRVKPVAGDTSAHLKYARALLQNKRIADAEQSYLKALELDSYCMIALVALGKIYLAQGKYFGARAKFSEVIGQNPNSVDGYLGLAEVLLAEQAYDDAMEKLEHALSLEPHNVDVLLKVGDSALRKGDGKKALAVFRSALKLAPEDLSIQERIGDIYSSLGQFDEALTRYKRVLESMPDAQQVLVKIGNALVKTRRFAKAAEAYQSALSKDPHQFSALLGLGNIFYEEQEYDKALQYYNKAEVSQPGMGLCRYWMGEALTRLDRRSEAIAAYQAAITFGNGKIPMARIKLGRLYLLENDPENAIEVYTVAALDETVSTAAFIGLGEALSARAEYPDAISAYEHALSNYRDLPYVRLKLAESNAAIGQLDKATTEIDDLLAFRRRFAEAHLLRGNILLGRSADQAAIDSFQQALVLKPKLARAHIGLGMVYLRIGDRLKAIFEYHAALYDEGESGLAKKGLEIAKRGSVDAVETLVSDYLGTPLLVRTGVESELRAMLPQRDRHLSS